MRVPVEEGGVGIRDFVEIQNSLYVKFAWQLLTQNFLWARFFGAKYVKHVIHFVNEVSSPCSIFWKKIASQLHVLVQHTKWKIREGNVSFWFNKFLKRGPLFDSVEVFYNRNLKLRNFLFIMNGILTNLFKLWVIVLRWKLFMKWGV